MLFWYIFVFVVYALAIFSYKYKNIRSLPWIFLFLASGFRYNVGTDYAHYYHLFIYQDGMFEYKEPGYVFLVKLFSDLGLNPQVMFLCFSFVTIFLFYKSFQYYFRHSEVGYLFATLLFIPFFYFFSLNAIRQALAVAIFFYSIRYIFEKRFVKYFVLIVVGSLFHRSILVMLPLYYFFNLAMSRYKIIFVYTIMIVILLINPMQYLVDFYVQNKFPLYYHFNDQFYGGRTEGFGRITAIVNVFIVLMLAQYLNMNNKLQSVVFNMIIVFSMIKLFALDIVILDRLSNYFKPVMVLFIIFSIANLSGRIKDIRKLAYFGLLSLTMAYTFLVIYIRGISDESYNQYALNLYFFDKSPGVVQIYGNHESIKDEGF